MDAASGGNRFDLLPAIDVRGGRVVRLRQGDFERQRIYGDDPISMARRFVEAGTRWIHVVDLDGARDGDPRLDPRLLQDLARIPGPSGEPLQIEIGGGLRRLEDLQAVLDTGCARAVIGTAAIADPAFVGAAIERFGRDRIAVALDLRGDRAVGDGWTSAGVTARAGDVLRGLKTEGVATVIVTAIDRDGMLDGPDLALLESIVATTSADVIASGGIRSIGDLDAIRAIGCTGAIVGRALYEGTIDLGEALEHVARGLPSGG